MEFLIGSEENILWWQMLIRAAIVFVVGLVFIKIGGKRLFGRSSAFDILIWIVLGSLMSRTITGDSPLGSTLLTIFFLIILHRILSFITFHSHSFGSLVKGEKVLLVENGEIKWDNMKKSQITEHDLKEAMRNNGKEDDISLIAKANLERNGSISIISKKEIDV